MLVVDDSNIVRRAIGSLLEESGYAVDTASSGEEAFERCVSDTFDLVISDVTMGALSGVQLCRLLRSDPVTSDMPIVLLTAADDPRSRFWGRNAGADAYVPKELMQSALLTEVARAIATKGRRSDVPRQKATKPRAPLERLSQVLDELLFQAVVASEARSLFNQSTDRRGFARALVALAGEVADYAYLSVRLDGPEPSFTLHTRGPWPGAPQAADFQALGLAATPETIDVVVEPGSSKHERTTVEGGEVTKFPIQTGDETLGEITAFGGRKRLAGGDRNTLDLLAREVGLVAKSVFLMEETKRLARTDGLTGLHNRLQGAERLDIELEGARRHGNPLTVAICDVDHFKQVNDVYGHNTGDVVLKRVAAVLKGAVRKVDLVARWGGEEFLVILPHTSEAGGRIAAERLRAAIERAAPVPEGPERVTISIGVATFAGDDSAVTFVERADQALYRAKRRGRNRVEVSVPGSNEKV